MTGRWLQASLAFSLWWIAPAAPAAAQPGPPAIDPAVADEARALFDLGVRFSDEERWSEALDAFRRSRALVERPSTLFNIATSLQRLGRAGDALVATEAFLAIADPVRDGAQVDQARALRVALRETLAHLVVRLRPATASLSVDARPIATPLVETDVRELELDPGEHVLEVSAPGFLSRTFEVSTAPGSRSEESVELERIGSHPAELTIRASRADARITVDDADVGVSHAAVEVDSGQHLVRVEAPEHVTYERLVVVEAAERLEIIAPLERAEGGSIAEEPAFWIVTAAIIAAGVGAGIGVGLAVSAPTPYGGSSGVSITGLTIPW